MSRFFMSYLCSEVERFILKNRRINYHGGWFVFYNALFSVKHSLAAKVIADVVKCFAEPLEMNHFPFPQKLNRIRHVGIVN